MTRFVSAACSTKPDLSSTTTAVAEPASEIAKRSDTQEYVSRGLVRGARKEDAGSHCRVGAQELERQVVEVLAQQLSRPELLSEAASGTWSAATRTLVRDNIERVVVDRREVQLISKFTTRTSTSDEACHEGDTASDTPKVYRAPCRRHSCVHERDAGHGFAEGRS